MFRIAFLSILFAALLQGSSPAYRGRVVDAVTRAPLADAVVTLGEQVVRTDSEGQFSIGGADGVLHARAYGHGRASLPARQLRTEDPAISLPPFVPKALYLSFYGIGSRTLRERALAIVDHTEVNALVIDLKGDRGLISYASQVPLAITVNAERTTTIPDLGALTSSLREKGIYTIARIVAFKDDVLARSRPDLAVTTRDGAVWRDREQLAWTDPLRREVWNYNVALAVEAAQAGFDEIQFDYVRFPDASDLVFSSAATEAARVDAIEGFLELARTRLAPFNVFLAADVFGYVCWNTGDTHIGQRLESILSHIDYLSPMLYPSSFQFGIPGFRNPVQVPYEVVYRSLERARARTGVPAVRFRPWLQAFPDYAFDRRAFGPTQVQAQIAAAEDSGADGWMLWNPHNVYTEETVGAESTTAGIMSGLAKAPAGPDTH